LLDCDRGNHVELADQTAAIAALPGPPVAKANHAALQSTPGLRSVIVRSVRIKS
jgi:hypothetical protein